MKKQSLKLILAGAMLVFGSQLSFGQGKFTPDFIVKTKSDGTLTPSKLYENPTTGNISLNGITSPLSKFEISTGSNPLMGTEYKMLGIGHNSNSTTFSGFAFCYGVNGDASKGITSSNLSLKFESSEILKINELNTSIRQISLITNNLNIINKTTPTISHLNINSNGNIAIGYPVATVASQKLDVNGNIKATGLYTSTFTNTGLATFNNTSTSAQVISIRLNGSTSCDKAIGFQDNGVTKWWFGRDNTTDINSNGIGFWSADTKNFAFQIKDDGEVNLGTTGKNVNINGKLITNGFTTNAIEIGVGYVGNDVSTSTLRIENNFDGYHPSIILSGNAGREKSIIFTDGGTNPVWWFGRDDASTQVKEGIGLFSTKIGAYGDFPFWIKDDGEVNIGIANKNVNIHGNLIASSITTNGLTNKGHLIVGGSDLNLGSMDGRFQGDNILNRALVHGDGDVLIVNWPYNPNYKPDFEGGVLIGGPKVTVDGILDVNKAIRAFDGVEIVSDKTLSLGPWKISQEGGGDVTSYLRINRESSGNGVTTVDRLFALDWNGNLTVKGVTVTVENFPDYVFEKDYNLMSIEELDTYIKTNKHLPNVPSAADVKENGANLGDLNKALLEKVEELTLYIIEQQKQINELKAAIKK